MTKYGSRTGPKSPTKGFKDGELDGKIYDRQEGPNLLPHVMSSLAKIQVVPMLDVMAWIESIVESRYLNNAEEVDSDPRRDCKLFRVPRGRGRVLLYFADHEGVLTPMYVGTSADALQSDKQAKASFKRWMRTRRQ